MPEGPPRLTPEMASFRLLVLGVVRDYLAAHHGSPSYGEISAALDSGRTRVKKAVKALVADGLLLQGDGPRSLSLPTARDDALRQLCALGFTVDHAALRIIPPDQAGTDRPLLPPPALDYLPGRSAAEGPNGAGETEDGHGQGGSRDAA